MSDAPDPLGKRALYWAPAERHEDGPRNADESHVPGKHALYSDAGTGVAAHEVRPREGAGSTRGAIGRAGHPSNRRPLGDLVPARVNERYAPGRPDDLERPTGSGMFGSLSLQCSSCRVRSQVDLVEYIVLHLPLWFWRPGRGYSNFMTCPACHRRTWVSASWAGWSR